jgi:tetratricopeptide (TPR) repeat protein
MSSTPPEVPGPGPQYAAFISYSHVDRDHAEWLHRALEGYRPPAGVSQESAGQPQLRPVFLDRAELPSSSDLAASVREALGASRCLIVVCSPAAARSRWVNEEIRYFKSLGRTDRILALLVSGRPNVPADDPDNCLPPALRYVVSPQGAVTDVEAAEPLAADIRPGGDDRRSAMLKVAAGILRVPLDRLVQRDNARRHRRLVWIAGGSKAACLVLAALSVIAVKSRNEAVLQRRIAVQQSLTAQRTSAFLKSLFAVSDPSEARGRSITALEVLDRGAKQIESQLTDDPVVRADLMTTLGEVYGSLGLLHKGVGLLQEAQSLPSLPLALTARQFAAIGGLQLQEGNLDAAKASLEQARNLVASPSPVDTALYVRVQNSLGETYWRQENCAGARAAYGESMRATAHENQPEQQGWIIAREGVAQCDMDDGNYAAAELGFRAALQRQLTATGEMHPRAAELLNELGSVRYFQGDRAGATDYFQRTLRIDKQVLGENHPDVTFTTNNLARVLLEQRRFAEARALLEPSLRAHTTEVLATDPNMVFFVGNMALIEMGLGNLDAASPLFDEALRNAVLNKHRMYGPLLTDAADFDCRTGHPQAALERLDQAAPILAARYPDDAWRVAHLQSVRAGCMTRLKRYAEAEPLIASSTAQLLKKWPPDTLYGHDALQRALQLYRLTGDQTKLERYQRLADARATPAAIAR